MCDLARFCACVASLTPTLGHNAHPDNVSPTQRRYRVCFSIASLPSLVPSPSTFPPRLSARRTVDPFYLMGQTALIAIPTLSSSGSKQPDGGEFLPHPGSVPLDVSYLETGRTQGGSHLRHGFVIWMCWVIRAAKQLDHGLSNSHTFYLLTDGISMTYLGAIPSGLIHTTPAIAS